MALSSVKVALAGAVWVSKGGVGAAVQICDTCVYIVAGIVFETLVAGPAAGVMLGDCGAIAWKKIVGGECVNVVVAWLGSASEHEGGWCV